jgi:hypothetical protein
MRDRDYACECKELDFGAFSQVFYCSFCSFCYPRFSLLTTRYSCRQNHGWPRLPVVISRIKV